MLVGNIAIKEIPDIHVAYVRHIGRYKGDAELFNKLFMKLAKWAGPRGLIGPDTKAISLYNDIPEITDENNLRLTACISIPKGTSVTRDIGELTIVGGVYAVARFEITKDEFEMAWDYVYKDWLMNSGYQPDDKPSFEMMLNKPDDKPGFKYLVDFFLPVKPM